MTETSTRELFDELHAVVLPVEHMARARTFYEGLLGLMPVRVFEHGVLTVYPVGETTHLCLYQRGADTPAGTGPAAYANWRVDDLEAVHARLVEKGIECSDIGGDDMLRLFKFHDPDGNRHDVCSFGRDWARSIGMPVSAAEEAAEMPDDLATIATFQTFIEAQAAQVHLEHADIRAWIADSEYVTVDPLAGNAVGNISLRVATSDVARAREIVGDLERASAEREPSGPGLDCMQCGAPVPEEADACPACGWSWDA